MRLCPGRLCVLLMTAVCLVACDRRSEIPRAGSQQACSPQDLGAAEDFYSRSNLPIDQVVTFEGMPHQVYFGWNQNGKQRAISKLLGTERKVLLFQEFEGKAPPTTTKITGLLRRYRDLPSNPWDAVRQSIKREHGWEVPEDAYVLMEGFRPEGCN